MIGIRKVYEMRKERQLKALGTMRGIAVELAIRNISFDFTPSQITVKDANFDCFKYATYHATTKEMCLMDYDYNEVFVSTLRDLFEVTEPD